MVANTSTYAAGAWRRTCIGRVLSARAHCAVWLVRAVTSVLTRTYGGTRGGQCLGGAFVWGDDWSLEFVDEEPG